MYVTSKESDPIEGPSSEPITTRLNSKLLSCSLEMISRVPAERLPLLTSPINRDFILLLFLLIFQ